MATITDIGVTAGVNLLIVLIFLLAFAFLRIQPSNDRVYFPKWYLRGLRSSARREGGLVSKFVNVDFWSPDVGLDSAIYMRIYIIGLKIFIPITFLAFVVLVPINFTNNTLASAKDATHSNIDNLSISNIPQSSNRGFIKSFIQGFILGLALKLIQAHFVFLVNSQL